MVGFKSSIEISGPTFRPGKVFSAGPELSLGRRFPRRRGIQLLGVKFTGAEVNKAPPKNCAGSPIQVDLHSKTIQNMTNSEMLLLRTVLSREDHPKVSCLGLKISPMDAMLTLERGGYVPKFRGQNTELRVRCLYLATHERPVKHVICHRTTTACTLQVSPEWGEPA